ncbi:hypothetical protein [Thiohalocapsa sp. ML1]|uniref:hypothetical protein n=1 Tax=Thiohalocapsa sp. ML1 TaxID=1431688 RepID=UPI00138EDA6D|nr:hypothetical protein [Thiohalocapsa sp. ML1]
MTKPRQRVSHSDCRSLLLLRGLGLLTRPGLKRYVLVPLWANALGRRGDATVGGGAAARQGTEQTAACVTVVARQSHKDLLPARQEALV